MSFQKMDIRDLYRCVGCGNCRSVCPVFEQTGTESKNTRGRIMVIRDVYEGKLSDESVFDSINTCTTCGYCTQTCPAGVRPPEIVEAARNGLAKQGKMTPAQKKIFETVRQYSNTIGDAGDRLEWFKKSGLQLPKNPKAVYFAGCLGSYRYPETVLKTYTLLNKLGVGLLEDEKCCGSPLLRLGFDAGDLMKHNIRQIEKSGAETIISGCAGCYNTLKNNYSLTDCQNVTAAQYLAAHLDELKKIGLKKLNLKVTYHDPCHSGRHNGVFDEPRRLIREICGAENFLEMRNNREKSRCCGGGGGVRSGYNELSVSMAKERIKDTPKDADYIVTTCPLCLRNLRDANGSVPVIDLTELICMALEK